MVLFALEALTPSKPPVGYLNKEMFNAGRADRKACAYDREANRGRETARLLGSGHLW